MYIPLKLEKNILSHQENSECEIIIPKLVYNNPTIELNDTASYILKSIDGKNTIEDIFNNIKKTYNILPENDVYDDINTILYQLWKLGIIGWKENKNPYSINFLKKIKNYSIDLVTLESVDEFLLKSKNNFYEYCNPYRYKNKILKKDYLEQAVINNFSYNFYIKNNAEKIMSIILSVDFKELVITMDYFNINDIEKFNEISKETFIEFLEWIEQKIIESGVFIPRNFKKINWLVLLGKEDIIFNEILDRFNPVQKVLLKNETITGDVYLYSFERALKIY